MRKSIVWIPVLFVGSMVYWTLALGFGGMSLVSVTSDGFPCGSRAAFQESEGAVDVGEPGFGEAALRDGFQSITVNLQSQAQSDDAMDPLGQTLNSVIVDLVGDDNGPASQAGTGAGARAGTDSDDDADADRRGSGRRARSDQGPGETAF